MAHKALAFPASSAHQPCGVVSLQPVTHYSCSYLKHFVLSGENAGHFGEMVLLTMIARLADGLPLAASMQEDEQVKKISYVATGVVSLLIASLQASM